MTRTGFVFANLFRNKTRTALTMLSLVTAFLLFGLLQAVNVMFNAGADFSGATRLIVQARVSFTQALPISQLPRIEAEPGVKRVTYQQWFGGVIGENTQLFVLAVDPVSTKDVYSEFVMPDEQWKAFAENRTSMIAGRQVAEQYGWKIGERIPIKSNIFPNQDGSKNWAFDLVGIFDGVDDEAQRRTNVSYINWNYFNEANQ
ncbi:MAG: ABC transporter permease, partial [Planctomycetota bacterium]